MYFVDDEEMSKKSIAPGVEISVVGGDQAPVSYTHLEPTSPERLS